MGKEIRKEIELQIKEVLPGNLRAARLRNGLSQCALARRVQSTQSSIETYENARNIPSVQMLVLLAIALDTTLDTLLPILAADTTE